jgi:exonuclease VII large subunit
LPICRKPSGGEPTKPVTAASAIQSALPPPPTGATVSVVPAVADALQHCRQVAVILESLQERKTKQEGNPLFLLTRFFLLNSFTHLCSFQSIVLIRDLEMTRKALSTEQSARSEAKKILQQSKDVNAALSLKLDNVETSLALTQTKLDRRSKALKIVEADLKAKGLLLESTQQALAKREGSTNMMISSAVAHTATLFKNHLSDLNVEILRQDFTVDDSECEALVSNVFDAAQDFVSSYDFTSLVESDDNDSPKSL